MSRMIVLCCRPRHLDRDEAAAAIERALPRLAAAPDVAAVRLTPLSSASLRWAPMFDWLIEAELSDAADPGTVIASPAWRDVLADLRLLGMRPAVGVAEATLTKRIEGTC